jgi:hypothetical protein
MAANMGRRIPGGAESLVMSVDAANDKCQSRNLYLCPDWGVPGTTQTSGNMAVDGTGNFFRVPIGTIIGGYKVTGTDIVYGYTLGGTGCHYKGWDINIGPGNWTFAFDYFVTTDANNFPTVNYLANIERTVGGSVGTNSIKGKWQTVSFGGNNSSIAFARPLLYPGACSSSYLASSGTLYYKNPRFTLGTSAGSNDFDKETVGGRGGSYSYRVYPNHNRMFDMVTGNYFGASSNNDRPLEDTDGGGCWSFTAATDYWVMAGANEQLNNQTYTMECWIKTNALNQNGFWFEKGSVNTQYSFFQEGTNIVHRTNINGSSDSLYTASSLLNTSDWFHMVATYDGSTKRTYVDGVERSSKNISGTISTNNNQVWIGRYGNAASYQYNGKIAKINIYNRALSSDEVDTQFRLDRVRFGK